MPRIIGAAPADFWENKVIQALKQQLPDDWVVLPSVMWTLEKNGYVRDGEADIVVLVPNLGLAVIEVKGSREFQVSEEGIWQRKLPNGGWFSLNESPPEQATRNMHDLTRALSSKQGWSSFPGTYSYLVVYPQGKTDSLPSMFDESTIATYRHMSQLKSRIRNSLEKRSGGRSSAKFTAPVIEAIVDQLKDRKFHVQKVDTEEDVSNDINKIEQLTRQQFASLKGLFQLPNIAIIGPAGSGKTVLAMWRLKALAEQGKRAIYVCYNRALAESLRLNNPEHSEYIWNVDKLFLKLCPENRNQVGNTEFHREILPGYVMDKSHILDKYDAIIVDEGQDFSEEQVIALLELKTEEGQWAFFADWKQDLYGAGIGTPIGADVVFHLHYNCRNTIKISDASNRCVDTQIESMPGMPIGEPPVIQSSGNQSKVAWELAKQWNGEGSVAILSPYKHENSAMKGQTSGHGLRLSQNIQDLGCKDTVFFSTIKSFKGLEASTIIVVDTTIPDDYIAFPKEDLYVACTRATTRLALVSSNRDTEKYLRELLSGL
ncbi:NERD domain-containing protein [Vibrio europaeus]|uniref:DNA 3'-5' helicase II n=1 Tax=Vibrio europaeus TaxID=300876 RepID=A0AAE7DW14_9VIBR|nr:NERD domain-containing protein [Vibrio europaeus]MDC5803448.1 NERD domain-containing protein [Vibrio europaeus]MDC5823320.1 NERD domain-containing protein [Vibrio europaeus]MDC5828841.1 NERD domain-containing protein [Vibrio europaeus]MDC5833054.1 NERD domain-containing protein [Vibrio europaeus]QJY35798.1 ATP-binding domain-containing protein [Vibrio europaeus]